MHAAALAECGARFADWRYRAFDVEPALLPEALRLMAGHGFRGVNLTVPHKIQAVGLVAAIDPAAREAGAVNTLLLEDGRWRGFNTDGYGLSAGIREDLGLSLEGTPVVLLGAGGAARGAAVECLRRGCSELWIVNRSRPGLDELIGLLRPLAGAIPVHGAGPGLPPAAPSPGALVINATSAGLRAADEPAVELGSLPGVRAVFDMVYNPPETRLLARARALGLPAANGLGMLVHQGAKSLEIWTGVPAVRTAPAMRAAAALALGS